ncbi:hypothetical protein [Ancylobacter pratisalsi]|uniref:Uncharacterized protein n=1 Tax=Ancylobacter pratisalsi TaxID=1745854 RepID=A0A6P1YW62_9HYPH|nr:hypothetical protein [Ancylobacter pratisalsi]QIB35814.1 hypothetical protein G3A50_20430 [Ancylobacter pratisalsi]
MTAPLTEPLWVDSMGKGRPLRFFAPPNDVAGAFPYVAAADVIGIISPRPATFAGYVRAIAGEPEVHTVSVDTDTGPVLLIPHPHARALLTVSVEDGAPLEHELAGYLRAVENALVAYLSPMTERARDAWLAAVLTAEMAR